MDNKNLVEECIKTAPLLLLKQKNIQEEVFNYLPFSIGIEFECFKKSHYNEEIFRLIPNIMEVKTDSNEQRYRIPNGINGLVCLYYICRELKNTSEIDIAGGLHFHVDLTKIYEKLDIYKSKESSKLDFILNELDSWNYKGNYNSRRVDTGGACWVKFQSIFKTMEIRIGEPTFDYELIIKRILHCVDIAKTLYKMVDETIEYKEVDIVSIEDILNFNKNIKVYQSDDKRVDQGLLNLLSELEESDQYNNQLSDYERFNLVKNRVVRI